MKIPYTKFPNAKFILCCELNILNDSVKEKEKTKQRRFMLRIFKFAVKLRALKEIPRQSFALRGKARLNDLMHDAFCYARNV